jgi:phage gpG-like protein
MPFYVSVDDKQVLEVLQRIAERFQPKQMRPAMMQIGEKLLASTKKRFDMAVAPDGTPWAPIKPGTILAHIRMMSSQSKYWERSGKNKGALKTAAVGRALHPLIATGRLQKSLNYRILDDGAGVAIGTGRALGETDASVHQFGTKHIPARPFLGLSTDDKTTVLEILNKMLNPGGTP